MGSKKPNNKALKYAESLRPMLQDLRFAAHNPNVCGAAPGMVMMAKRDGWEFGCKVEDHGGFMRRKVFLRAEQPLRSIPEHDKDPVMNVVMDEMLDRGTPATSIETIAENCVMIVQDFIPILLHRTETAKTHIKIDDNPLLDAGRILQ